MLAPGLEFVHPLVLGAIYAQIPPHERERLHLRAAAAVPERAALHLLRVAPAGDAQRVAVLREAARSAPAGTAVTYLRARARRAATRPRRRPARARPRRGTDRRPFEAHLREALAATGPRDVALDLVARWPPPASCAPPPRCSPPTSRTSGCEAELLTIAFNDFTAADLAQPVWERRFAELARGEAPPPLIARLPGLALVTSRPPAAAGVALAERGVSEPEGVVAGCVGNALAFGGRLRAAGAFYDACIAGAGRLQLSWLLVLRAQISLRLGEVRRAEAEARSGLELVRTGSGAAAYAWAQAHLIEALVARGALEDAEALAGHEGPPSFPQALYHCALSRLRLAQGRPAEADARAAGKIVGRIVTNPAACAWRSDLALASGVADEGELADARRYGVPDAIGIALRTHGIVTRDVDALRESVAVLERSENVFEHARAVLELGAALRRTGARVQAREVLRLALDLNARTGATAHADRAHAELVAAGARPRRERRLLSGRESLTASEDRVAALAADGLTNREIAQKLFVTPKAVQWHLRNVYRKLDVSSREDLAENLGGGG